MKRGIIVTAAATITGCTITWFGIWVFMEWAWRYVEAGNRMPWATPRTMGGEVRRSAADQPAALRPA